MEQNHHNDESIKTTLLFDQIPEALPEVAVGLRLPESVVVARLHLGVDLAPLPL
jgi:hypothetical protein